MSRSIPRGPGVKCPLVNWPEWHTQPLDQLA